MEPTIPTPPASSTITTSSTASSSNPSQPSSRILEISLISAQDLAPVSKSMRPYAVTWVQPGKKLSTRIDTHGHANPTWNDKFAFRVADEVLFSDNSVVSVEIYTTCWLRDVLVGTVKVLLCSLINPSSRTVQSTSKNWRFVALQVRRPSGAPQGILNMGFCLLDSTMRSMPFQGPIKNPTEDFQPAEEKKMNTLNQGNDSKKELEEKIQLWRSMSSESDSNNDEFPLKPGSVHNGSLVNGSAYNGSAVNGSEMCSDIGPSASIVAAELAKKTDQPQPRRPNKVVQQTDETGSSILEDLTIEEATAKGYKFKERHEIISGDEPGSTKKHPRRNSDSSLFSCFGNAYGIEFTIVCGAGSGTKLSTKHSRRKKPSGKANSA